jgi:hypothetical protein
MSIQELPAKVAKAVSDPVAAIRWLKRQVVPPPKKPSAPLRNAAKASLQERLAEIRAAGFKRIAVHGDRKTFDQVMAALPGCELTWIGGDFAELNQGATALRNLDAAKAEAFLVAGGDVPANYRQIVRWLALRGAARPVLWVSDIFEFCAGTVPIAAGCSDADIDIFNHFADFLGLRESLLVRIEVFDQVQTVTRWMVFKPRQGVRVRLSEWLPNRQGPACVFHYCAHPVLTRGRHYRWRATGHLHWNGSTAMVHGGHDFSGLAGSTIEHKIGAGSFRHGSVVFSLPNYLKDATEDAASVETLACNSIGTTRRRTDARIDELVLDHDGHQAQFGEFYGVKFKGYGESFWFGLDRGDAGQTPSLSVNHSVAAMIRPGPKTPASPETVAFVDRLRSQHLILDPHPLPVEQASSPIEFGFEFDMNNPILREFNLRAYDAEGRLLGEMHYNKKRTGAVFAGELLAEMGVDPALTCLILVSPDWIAEGFDPRNRGAAGNLVARLRANGDYDMTEFQNCWRNVGVKVDRLPHWLSPDRMLAGRTNVLCGVAAGSDIQVATSVTNGSGDADYADAADAHLRLVAPDGTEITGHTRLPPFGHRLLWLDEVMPAWRRHLRDGYGTLIVQSSDADLNANLVTVRQGRTVTMQHMWGY